MFLVLWSKETNLLSQIQATRLPELLCLCMFHYILFIFYFFFCYFDLFALYSLSYSTNVLSYLRTPQDYFARQLRIIVRLCEERISLSRKNRLIKRYRRLFVNKRAAIQIYAFIFQYFQKITGFQMKHEPVPDEDEVTVVARIFDAEQDYALEISCDMRNMGNNMWRSVDAFMDN